MFSSNPTTVVAAWSLVAILAMIVTGVLIAIFWPAVARDPEPTRELPAEKIARARAMIPTPRGCWPLPGRRPPAPPAPPEDGAGRHRRPAR